jgi:uncharacterized membrane protein YbaN (DUF454 family)
MALAYGSLAVGIVGIVVPGLPTTPLGLLAAFAADRGSPKLHRWLIRHKTFGPMIQSWERERAVSRRAKWLATIMMSVCAAIMYVWGPGLRILATTVAIMATVAIWLWRRPEPGHAAAPVNRDEATAADPTSR